MTKRSQRFRLLWLWVGIVVLASLYNNCGQNLDPRMSAGDFRSSGESAGAELMAKYGYEMEADSCRRSDSYRCVRRVFSVGVESYEKPVEFPCQELGGVELCVKGQEYGFNSALAAASCGEACDRDYEYEEFSCYLRWQASDGTYPLAGVGSRFAEAIEGAYSECEEFLDQALGPQGVK